MAFKVRAYHSPGAEEGTLLGEAVWLQADETAFSPLHCQLTGRDSKYYQL